MKWFKSVRTVDELKKQYKILAMKHHPDRGGKLEDMQEINAEFDMLFKRVKDIHQTADGKEYTKATSESAAEYRDIISKVINLDGVDVEICGSWIWLTGNTYAHRAYIKQCGFGYSRNKKAWYYHKDPYIKYSNKVYSMDDIREQWGSEKIDKDARERLVN